MKLGIVGLPNVGKSTLFNSLTKAGAESANYPFCTIDPNVGVVPVPDERLDVLAEKIYSNKANSTRFIIVTNQRIFQKDADKISICFELPHSSGTLYNILSHFIYNGINMTKIESRPIFGRNWEYRFFVDFEGNLNDGAVKNALRGIREEAMNMRILGNY